jgi:hypothetical protein
MRKLASIICLLTVVALMTSPVIATEEKAPVKLKLLEVKKVWDQAPHNSFTDLIFHDGHFYMTFREAASHMYNAPSGDIRILKSANGVKWESFGLVKYGTPDDDLRDAKLTITPDGRMILYCALAPKEDHLTRQSYAYLYEGNGRWSEPHKVADFNYWLWQVVWAPDGYAYGLGYNVDRKSKEFQQERLYRSSDGINWETFINKFNPYPNVNESTMVFCKNGSAVALLRRDAKNDNHAIVGITEDPKYKRWLFGELNVRIGGPSIIELPCGTLLAAGRLYDKKVRTSVGLLEPEKVQFTELLALPSGGDCSYPGLVYRDGILWMSYYSSHEGKTSIYLAKIAIEE